MRRHTLTTYKLGLLDRLDYAGNIQGYNRSHAERALREMQEIGLCSQSLSGHWSVTREGRELVRKT
jgi:DNA-binding IclR family transcriptional regulator